MLYLERLCLSHGHAELLLGFLIRVLGLLFRLVIHFEFVSVSSSKKGPNFIHLPV